MHESLVGVMVGHAKLTRVCGPYGHRPHQAEQSKKRRGRCSSGVYHYRSKLMFRG